MTIDSPSENLAPSGGSGVEGANTTGPRQIRLTALRCPNPPRAATPPGLDSEGVYSLFPTCQAPSAWTWFRDRHLASAPDTIGISRREKQGSVLQRLKSSRDRRG